MILKSETIGKLADALAKAQAEIEPAKMNSRNPFLKNKYADLSSVVDSFKGPLSKHGLSFVQMVTAPEDDSTGVIELTTLLMHSSGEWLQSTMSMRWEKGKGQTIQQSIGVAISYARRYSLSAMLGIVSDEDTDGSVADVKPKRKKMTQEEETELMSKIKELMDNGVSPKDALDQLKGEFPDVSMAHVLKAKKE
jgi:hypothetical protein